MAALKPPSFAKGRGRMTMSALARTILPVALAAVWCGAGGAPAAAQTKYIVTSPVGTGALLPYVGIRKGFYKEQGLDIELKEVQRGSEGLEAMVAGSVHFSDGANTPFIAAVAAGAPIVGVALHSHGFFGKLIASPQNAHLKRLEDFKGKEIGVQVGTGVHTVLLMAIEKVGLKESDFTISNVRNRDMPAARQSGRFDAVIPWEPSAARIVQNGWGKEIMGPPQWEKLAGITFPFIVSARRDFVEKNPEAVQKYLNAWVKIQNFVEKNRPEAVKLMREQLGAAATGMSDEDLDAQIVTSHFDRAVFAEEDLNDLKQTASFMARKGQIKEAPDFAKVLDMRFATKASAAR
jgi:aliphatic sulfonates family ABC transporter substrate-binding protein